MAKKTEKTNAMRVLDKAAVSYHHYTYDEETVNAVEVAHLLGQEPARVFKTLVTVGKSREHYVFMLPSARELDLKKAAKAAGEKALEMIKQKELLPLTGYIHGGCSPIGMKKPFKTFIHHTAEEFETIFFSAGHVGHQVEMPLSDLQKVVNVTPADLVVDD